ncbi:DUF4202 domain-containing protein [Membranihabitans marinus]|uniref:DUF4202 domain-containing protein n=1 Tax=Membranihabitans marinus TaxID=1227546 RepID=UPI001F22B834|nr:DUF4202 domain-containing protein [Membranihabitans marinus]
MTQLQKAIAAIDQLNSQDPNQTVVNGEIMAKELLYSIRMTEELLAYKPNASEQLQIAARAQHIARWRIPRDQYPMDRKGYLQWRTELKNMHANLTAEILTALNYSDDFIEEVSQSIKKIKFKTKAEGQTLEDVVCFVFLRYYFDDFAQKHEEEKVIKIIQKTWAKMSDEGKERALQLPLSNHTVDMVERALS